MIGGAAAACSSDASRLTSPFANPFAEPAATGSLPDDEPKPVAPLRTGQIQSEALGAPGAVRSAPLASAIPAPPASASNRVASVGSSGWSAQGGTRITVAKNDSLQQMATRYGVPASAILQANGLSSAAQVTPGRELVIPSYSNVSGLNPAAASMSARPARAAEERREDAKALEAREKDAKAEAAKRVAAKEKEAKEASARELKEKEAKEAAARKLAETKAAEAKAAEEKARKLAAKDGDKKHVRPGQTPKVAETKAEKAREEAKQEAKTAAKAEAAQKLAEAKAARDAAREAAKETAKESAKQAAAKEKPAKVEAKAETKAPKAEVAKAEPVKAEPVSTGAVAQADAENFRWPAKGRVISGYGTSGNEGINIALPEGTPVKAAEEGTVAYAGSDVKGYGKLVLVRHANGFVSAYAHNGEIDVKPGDKVKRGQTIAKSGASGNVTSPQLHFEIRKSGAPVDPMSQLASN
ncbi:murein DD-endopeptidase MepM/ murein hydrolase activator NlpD [Methylobacterium aerolatum]|uniref:Murein DD-endopeptidase MepM/ murein hydrolase activator NlpD n=2 Tax=Methylobacterium aerolatum TaxID=418708 RepID=A0ABU0I651_9HYPH|nr:murein DD-endopeptidase MepM/ murein hydrolase activator NlpD [Methylobacterium aerolatum]